MAAEPLAENAVQVGHTNRYAFDGVPRQLGVPVKSRKADILLPAHIGALVWLVSGFVLCAAETMTLGALLIWVGLAASTVGAIAYFVTVDLTPVAVVVRHHSEPDTFTPGGLRWILR